MVFHSLDYFILFAITGMLYYTLPKTFQNPLLLVASYIFYIAFDIRLTLYLVVMTLIVYKIALNIDNRRTRGSGLVDARQWMIIGVGICLIPLAFYKYFNFVSSFIVKIVGIGHAKQIDFLIPLGISFITFSLISYIVDVYQGTISAERNIIKFSLFVAFFPKVVQGPIEKAGDILPQFNIEHRFDLVRFREGMLLALYGLFMKMVVADTAGIAVDKIYRNLSDYSGAAIMVATMLFTIQIYCDFAGYSLISIGTAKVLGIEFKHNFHQPYLSDSVTEFWKRWHMSLNRWLTDYIYIPLGGNRCSKERWIINVLITFTVSGLWHGAAGGYIIWGLLNGVYVSAESLFKSIMVIIEKRFTRLNKMVQETLIIIVRRLFTFLLIMFSWIFFRAQRCHIAITVIKRILYEFNFRGFFDYIKDKLAEGAGTTLYGLDVAYNIPVLLMGLVIVIAVDIVSVRKNIVFSLSNGNRVIRWLVCYALIFAVILFGVYGYGYNSSDFIYTGF